MAKKTATTEHVVSLGTPPPTPPTPAKPLRADELPLISVMDRADMDRAQALMQDDCDYQEQIASINETRAAGKEELIALANKYNLPGMRTGNLVVYYGGKKTKRTLSKKLLAEFVDIDTIERCHTVSKPHEDIRIVDLSKPKKSKGDGDGNDE